MRLIHVPRFAATALALAAIALATPARADDFGKRITLNVAPVYLFSTNGDVSGSVPPGETGVGYTHDNPTANTGRINDGIDSNSMRRRISRTRTVTSRTNSDASRRSHRKRRSFPARSTITPTRSR